MCAARVDACATMPKAQVNWRGLVSMDRNRERARSLDGARGRASVRRAAREGHNEPASQQPADSQAAKEQGDDEEMHELRQFFAERATFAKNARARIAHH